MTEKRWRIFLICGLLLTAGISLTAYFASAPRGELTAERIPAAGSTAADTSAVLTETVTAQPSYAPSPTDTIYTETTMPDTNLNTADIAALMRVSGIGYELAERIAAYRRQIGGFTRRAQLTEIEGIGEALAAKIMTEFEIPDELPPETTAAVTETTAPAAGYYDLNKVTREELLRIPEMSGQQADEILDLRDKLHGFLSINELALTKSLSGEYIVHTLTHYLYVENDTGRPAEE